MAAILSRPQCVNKGSQPNDLICKVQVFQYSIKWVPATQGKCYFDINPFGDQNGFFWEKYVDTMFADAQAPWVTRLLTLQDKQIFVIHYKEF